MSLAQDVTLRTLNARQITAGTAEETLQLALDGAAAANAIAVPANTVFSLSDFALSISQGTAVARIQQSNDNGSTWFDVLVVRLGTTPRQFSLKSPVKVSGGAQVQLRARVATSIATTLVTLTAGVTSQP